MLKQLRLRQGLSEAELASRSGISRLTLRSIESGSGNPTWDSIDAYAHALGLKAELSLAAHESDLQSEDSILGISLLLLQRGFDAWPICLMNFVDCYRRSLDGRLIALAPASNTPRKYSALFASTVLSLCGEVGSLAPDWAKKDYFMERPWFPSETESLKAMALLESPVFFRKNNIFVLDNFLQRA